MFVLLDIGESWSFDAVQRALPRTTPTAMLIAIALASMYIFYKMLRIAFGYQTVKRSNQPRYVGSRDEKGLYTGQGELYNRNGDVYIGEFLNGLQHGQGKYVFNIPSSAPSNNQSVVPTKKPKSRKQASRLRQSDNQPNSQPLSNSSPSYEGEFMEGMFHGRGRETYADGSSYTGEFVRGHREGRGQMRYANGSVFDGSWLEGAKHGKGRIKEAGNQNWQSGMWHKGRAAISQSQNSSLNPSTESSDGRDSSQEEKTQ